jgi:hypothetical protein
MYVTTWPISKRGNKWEMLSYEAWTDGWTAVCHNKPVFWRAYKNEWPISCNYEYIIFGFMLTMSTFFHKYIVLLICFCRVHNILLSVITMSWSKVQETISSTNIPSKQSSATFTNPWANTTIKKLTRRKKKAYNKARRSNSEQDWAKYKRLKSLPVSILSIPCFSWFQMFSIFFCKSCFCA